MTADPVKLLQTALELTSKMRHAAGEQNWEAVAELDGRRAILLEQAFSAGMSAEDRNIAGGLTLEIHTLNEQVLDLCRQGRYAVAEELSGLLGGRQAAAAYAENQY